MTYFQVLLGQKPYSKCAPHGRLLQCIALHSSAKHRLPLAGKEARWASRSAGHAKNGVGGVFFRCVEVRDEQGGGWCEWRLTQTIAKRAVFGVYAIRGCRVVRLNTAMLRSHS